jgi:hypothetical protein
MKRIFSELKAQETKEGHVTIEGWANKPVVDDVGDKMAFDKVDLNRFKRNPIMFFNHDRDMPIGKWLEWKVSDAGLWVKGLVSNSKDPAISYIRDLVKEGILKTLSIGFEPKDEQLNREAGYNEIKEWRLNEVSVVTLPANIEAEFSLAKMLASAKTLDEARSIVKAAQEDPMPADPKNPDNSDPKEPTEDEMKSAFQDCVSAKIPKLIQEGKPQQQAVAIAMSMCREEGKCDVTIMSQAMFDFADNVASEAAKECNPKKPKEEKAQPGTPPATPMPQPSDDPTNFGNPYMDLMKSSLALLGKISEQLASMNQMLIRILEKEDETSNTEGENPVNPPQPSNGQGSSEQVAQKDLEKIKEIHERISNIVKDLKL